MDVDIFVRQNEEIPHDVFEYAGATDQTYTAFRFNSSQFGSPIWQKFIAYAVHPCGYALQVAAMPTLAHFKRTLFDCIAPHYSLPCELSAEELLLMRVLPCGWRLSTFRRYWPEALPDYTHDLFRPTKYCGLFNWPELSAELVHPELIRPLLQEEIDAISAAHESALNQAEAWIKRMDCSVLEVSQCCWLYDISNDGPHNTFNYSQPDRGPRFNIDGSGKIIHKWDAIRERA